MKKMVICVLMGMMFVSCDPVISTYGIGGSHACQYVKEQLLLMRGDIDGVEVVGKDSLLGDMMLAFTESSFLNAMNEYMRDEISKEEFQKIVDERAGIVNDVQDSWMYAPENEKLKGKEIYEGEWRVVYQVKVTMKSGVTKEVRVLMDNDGITPRMLESEYGKEIDKYAEDVLRADRMLNGLY